MTFTMRPRVYFHDTVAPLDAVTSGSWIEITGYVKSLDFAHGRSKGSDDFQPGNGRMILDNRDSLFDPSNTASPYYSSLKLRRRVRVDAYVENNGSPFAAPTIAYGYIEQWPQTWDWRYLVDVEVTWTDALGLLANHDLPDSVWDYAIKQHCDAGRVVAWHRWGDGNDVALDSSGNGNHGRYVISEAGQDPPSLGTPAPKSIVKAGEVAPITPQVFRPALNFGKMVAETGQPVATSSLGWRFPSVVCHPATSLWGTEFTVETWVLYRSAFALDAAGGASALTPRPQWIAFWGDPISLASGMGLRDNGVNNTQPDADIAQFNSTGGFVAWLGQSAHLLIDVRIDDGLGHHLAYRVRDFTTFWQVDLFLDGIQVGDYGTLKTSFGAGVNCPMEIGRQFVNRFVTSIVGTFALTLGDVVVYNEAITDQQIEDNYNAGQYGRLTGTGEVLSGTAIDQALDMAGWAQTVLWDLGDKPVAAGLIGDRRVVDFITEVARGEDGLLFQGRSGAINFWDEGWQRNALRGGTVRFSMTDGSPSGLTTPVVGYDTCNFTYDDSLLANSWSVDWAEGSVRAEDAVSIAEHGRYERSVSTLLANEQHAAGLANFRVWQRGQPSFEISDVSFDALAGDAHIEAVMSWCEIGTRIRVVRTRPNGTTIDDEYHIMSVTHRIDPGNGDWGVTLGLTLADSPGTAFIIGTSLIGGPDVIWY